MASLVRKIGRTTRQQGTSTLIHLENGFNPFTQSGTMSATIVGFLDDANISWEQISGVPVTYTTPTNGLVIGFTTTELGSKAFRVYTNRGTDIEESDTAQFYHGPIDNLTLSSSRSAGIFINDSPTQYIVKGVYDYLGEVNVANQVQGTIAVMPRAIDDTYLVIKPLLTPPSYFTEAVTKTELQHETSPNVWVTEGTVDGYVSSFSNLIDVSGADRRIVYTLYSQGLSAIQPTPPIVDSVGGYQEQVEISSSSTTGLVNLTTVLSTKINKSENDTLSLSTSASIGLSSYTTLLQTLEEDTREDIIILASSQSAGISNLTTILQTSITIG